jgi:hypothetical protein
MKCFKCFNQIVDKVNMTCSEQHSFCFKCLLDLIEADSEQLKVCPRCRGGDKYIILGNDLVSTGTGFYSLNYFKKTLPILQKFFGDNVNTDTCLIPEIVLVYYVINKKQIEVAHQLISLNYSIDDAFSLINWDEKRTLEDPEMKRYSEQNTYNRLLDMVGGPISAPVPLLPSFLPRSTGFVREFHNRERTPPTQRRNRQLGPQKQQEHGPNVFPNPPPFMDGFPGIYQ